MRGVGAVAARNLSSGWGGLAHHEHGVEMAAPPGHAPAEVRAGGAAGHANLPDLVAPRDTLARADKNSGLVEVDADQALAMVDHGQAAFEMHAGGGHADDAAGRGENGRALRRGQVRAVVRPLGFAVEDPLAAEPTGAPPALGWQRHGEPASEVLGVDAAGQGLLLELVLLFQPGQQVRVAGADLILGKAGYALDVEVAGGDGEDLVQGTVGVGDPQGCGRRGVAVEADDEQAAGAGAANRLVVQPEIGAGRGSAEGEAALLVEAADP